MRSIGSAPPSVMSSAESDGSASVAPPVSFTSKIDDLAEPERTSAGSAMKARTASLSCSHKQSFRTAMHRKHRQIACVLTAPDLIVRCDTWSAAEVISIDA